MNINMNAETIRDALSKRFLPHFIEVMDESGKHEGMRKQRNPGAAITS